MYISLIKNEESQKTVQELLRNNLCINVRDTGSLLWIEVNLRDYGYLAYVSVKTQNAIVIHSSITAETITHISLNNVEAIYDLD